MAWLAACGAGTGDGPFAPGIDRDAAAVDQMLVGKRLLAAQQYELAIKAFSRAALERQQMNGEILGGIGSANLGLGRLGQAEEQLRRAITYPDAPPEVWNNLGLVLLDQGQTAEAVEMLRRAYALDNGESDAIRDNLRMALASLGESPYDPEQQEEYEVVRSGRSTYDIRQLP